MLTDDTGGLLPFLTTRAEAILHRRAASAPSTTCCGQWPELDRDDVVRVADAVNRLTISHLVLPGGRPDEVAADIARLVDRLLPVPWRTCRMSTHELYTIPAEHRTWDVEMQGAARFTWEYDDGRDRLLSLYQKGKDKQWDQTTRIDWALEVDPNNALGMPVEAISIYGTDQWKRIENDQKAIDELSLHLTAWQFSQFLHGEQGAMICSARIVESVPDLDSKFYAATQTMDEARHAETYARFLQEKVGLLYPINPYLKALLDDTLTDSRWDMPYLGMQVLIEGLALAAFGVLRDMTTEPLPKQILAYVMQDEARHVAFGRMALKDYYAELTTRRARPSARTSSSRAATSCATASACRRSGRTSAST